VEFEIFGTRHLRSESEICSMTLGNFQLSDSTFVTHDVTNRLWQWNLGLSIKPLAVCSVYNFLFHSRVQTLQV